jgi:hypothetical protein
MVLRPRALATPPKEMTPQEQRALPLVDGLKPLRDIVAQSKLVEFEVYEALHHLLELGVIEVSLGAAPPKITPIVEEERRPAEEEPGPAGLFIGGIVALVSLAIGLLVSPQLLKQAEQAGGLQQSLAAPHEMSVVDEASRLTLALELYRAASGSYPLELGALAEAKLLPEEAVRHAATRFTYQSDGVTYTRLPGAGTP